MHFPGAASLVISSMIVTASLAPRSKRIGHQGDVISTAIAVATGVRRTADRVHSARVLGPHPRTQRGEPPQDHQVLSRLLPRQPHASLAGQGHARATEVSPASTRLRGRYPSPGGTPPPVRAPRRLN